MKIKNKDSTSKSPKNTPSQKENNNKNSTTTNSVTNNSQLLTLHQQQQYQQQQMIKQENARNLKLNQQTPLNQQQNLQSLQQQQQHNKIVQHFANLQQQQQQQQNRIALSNSSTISNLNPQSNQTGTLPRQMVNGQNSISNSLSTSAINSNIINGNHILNDNNNLARQIIQTNGPNSIYGRTISIQQQQQQPNQPIYNSSTLNKPIITNLNKQSIYGQTGQFNSAQLNQQQLNNNLIYASRQNPNLFKLQPQQQQSLYGQTGQFNNNSQLNLSQNQMNNRLNLFDEDSGIMSEVETASTGFRRLNKIRASLPIVRTMSKTTDRSLGLVFLQYNNSTKKSLLPNELTSLDTIKALFVRSFPNQLTMNFFEDKNRVRIYVHDQTKDMFYELGNFLIYYSLFSNNTN